MPTLAGVMRILRGREQRRWPQALQCADGATLMTEAWRSREIAALKAGALYIGQTAVDEEECGTRTTVRAPSSSIGVRWKNHLLAITVHTKKPTSSEAAMERLRHDAETGTRRSAEHNCSVRSFGTRGIHLMVILPHNTTNQGTNHARRHLKSHSLHLKGGTQVGGSAEN